MREGWVASAAGRVRFELRRGPPCIDRAAHRCVALHVRGVDAFLPVRIEVSVRSAVSVARANAVLQSRPVELALVPAYKDRFLTSGTRSPSH